MDIVTVNDKIDRYAAPFFHPRPKAFVRGRGDRREAIAYCDVEGTVITKRVPVRPIIMEITEGKPQLRAAALRSRGMTDELGFSFSDITKPFEDAGNWVADKAEQFAEDIGIDGVIRKAVDIGKKVVKVAKDIAYSPYFQAALVALPIPGTAAIAAGIRAVQTIELLAKQAASGNFDAKAALGLAKAGLKLKNAATPEAKINAEGMLKEAQEKARQMGISPDEIKKAVNSAKTAAESIVKEKFDVEKLVKDPQGVAKIVAKAKQTADPVKKETLQNLAKAVQERKQGKEPREGVPMFGAVNEAVRRIKETVDKAQKEAERGGAGGFRRRNLARTKQGDIVPASAKVRRQLDEVSSTEAAGLVYQSLKSPSAQNYINVRRLQKAATRLQKATREIKRAKDEAQRQKRIADNARKNWMATRKELQEARQADVEYKPDALRKMTPRITKLLKWAAKDPKRQKPGTIGSMMANFQRAAGIPDTGKYDPASRGALLYFGADNPPPVFSGSGTKEYTPPPKRAAEQAFDRPPKLERQAAAQGKRLYMVQAPSRKVYPVAV